jgi:hypothetical protein
MPVTGRQAVGFDDIRFDAITLWADNSTIVFNVTQPDGSAQVGFAVTYGAGTDVVKLCVDGDPVLGRLLKVEADGACSIQHKGMCHLAAGNAATITPGIKLVGALGPASAAGYVRNANSATAAELVKMGPIAVDNSDMTNVIVDFQ